MNDEVKAVPMTAGQAREKWSEFLFRLSVFFGALHFVGIFCQVLVMYARKTLDASPDIPLRSSELMGNIYLGLLAAYVGQKEITRWLQQKDDAVMPEDVRVKFSRGEVIVASWVLFTGCTVMLRDMGFIPEVPQLLVYTMGEVIALWCGSAASRYFRNRSVVLKNQDRENSSSFGDRTIDLCREKGKIDNEACQAEFGLSKDQSYRLLNGLSKKGSLRPVGFGKRTLLRTAVMQIFAEYSLPRGAKKPRIISRI